eukprot:EG_transcript_8467
MPTAPSGAQLGAVGLGLLALAMLLVPPPRGSALFAAPVLVRPAQPLASSSSLNTVAAHRHLTASLHWWTRREGSPAAGSPERREPTSQPERGDHLARFLGPWAAATVLGALLLWGRTVRRGPAEEGGAMLGVAGASVAALPATYRALWAPAVGDSFRQAATVRELPLPHPGPGEALVRVKYAGVNGGCETFRARGEFWFERNRTATDGFALGAEGVGIVVAVGEGVTNVQVGDAVAFLGGAFAEYVKCGAAGLWQVPAASPEAVALRISGLVAYSALHGTPQPVRPNETVLITAAAGALGHFAVQVAKQAGCHVIGTCSSAEKRALLAQLGCDRIINYKEEDAAEVLSKEYPGGVDFVLEGVGGAMLSTALGALAPAGRLVQIGYIAEYPHAGAAGAAGAAHHGLDTARLFWSSQTIQRGQQTIYGNPRPTTREVGEECARRVRELFRRGALRAVVDGRRFAGVGSVPDAVDYMLGGRALGKVVVAMEGPGAGDP